MFEIHIAIVIGIWTMRVDLSSDQSSGAPLSTAATRYPAVTSSN